MSVVAIGDNVVDCYLDSGMVYPGGNCVNVAVAVARAGIRSGYVGAFGSDFAGDLLEKSLCEEGVDLTRLRRIEGANSYATVTLVDGERVFGRGDKGVREFVPSDEDYTYLSEFKVAHSSYCSGLEEFLAQISATTLLSFDFDDRIESEYAESLLADVWCAIFSASGLSDAEVLDTAKWATERGSSFVLLTRGAQGAAFFDGTQLFFQNAAPTDIVDTLGAGDSFIGRMLVGLTSGESIPELLAAASVASSATCGLSGGFGYGAELPMGYP